MKLRLTNLQGKRVDELRNIFSAIPESETMIELVGQFQQTSWFWSDFNHVINSFSSLPRHVSTVKFNIAYVYSETVARVKGIGTHWSYAMGEVDNYDLVCYLVIDIGNTLEKFISALPRSVDKLVLKFIADTTREDKRRRISNVDNQFYGLLKNIPEHITTLCIQGDNKHSCFVNNKLTQGKIPKTITNVQLNYHEDNLSELEPTIEVSSTQSSCCVS